MLLILITALCILQIETNKILGLQNQSNSLFANNAIGKINILRK